MPRKEIYLQDEILGFHLSRRTFRVMQWNKVIEKSRTKEMINIDRCISQLNRERNRIAAVRNKLTNVQEDFYSTGKLIQQIHDTDDKSSFGKNIERVKQTCDDSFQFSQRSLARQRRCSHGPSVIRVTENGSENWPGKPGKFRGILNRRASHGDDISLQTNGTSSSIVCNSNIIRGDLNASHAIKNRRHSYELDRNAKGRKKTSKKDCPNVVELSYGHSSSTAKKFVEKEPKKSGDGEPYSKAISTLRRSRKEGKQHEEDAGECAERLSVSRDSPASMTSTSLENQADSNELALPKILERHRLSLLHITEIHNMVLLQKASSNEI